MSDYEFTKFMDSLDTGSSYSGTMEGMGIWTIIALILAIIGAVLVYFLFVKAKEEPKGKFLKWLKNFLAFKIMWIEPILKVVYYFGTIFIILFSFNFLALGGAGILTWLITLILGPIAVRLAYEMTMMFIMIWRNTENISEDIEKKKK